MRERARLCEPGSNNPARQPGIHPHPPLRGVGCGVKDIPAGAKGKMMSEPTGTPARELLVWAFAILCAALVLLSPVACTMARQQAVAKAIKNGADPIAAKCAIEGSTEHTPMCVAYAAARAQRSRTVD